VGVAVEAVARLLGLDFMPLQTERYDLAIPTGYLKSHRGLSRFLDTLVSRGVRAELQALGGYDTRDTGRKVDWRRRR
jgi:molybdate-binding protein